MRLFRRRRPRRRAESRDPRSVRALLDFGTSGARALVVRLHPDGVELLGVGEATGRSGIGRPGQVMQRERIVALAERALSAAEASTATDGQLPWIADEVLVGLTGPLLVAHSHAWHLWRSDPHAPIFQEELLDSLAAAQRRSLQAVEAQVRASHIRRTLVASELVGAASVRQESRQALRLPEVTRGVPGFAGEFLALALCNLTWPTKALEVLRGVVEALELTLTEATPIARAVAAALPRPDAILLDVGDEQTEIALAEGGALSGLEAVPLGGAHFTQALAQALDLTEKHAELLKQQHALRRDPQRGPVPRLLGEAVAPWRLAVEQTLHRMAGEAPLPPRIYLFGGGALLPELADQLRARPWAQRLPFEHPPSVAVLLPHALRGLRDPRGLLHSPAQVGLAALAAWAGRDPSPLQRHLDRVTRTLADELAL